MSRPFMPGVPAAGHLDARGYWHPGSMSGCSKCAPANRPVPQSRVPTGRRPQPGDRIQVVALMRDPAPIQIGTTGTVTFVNNEGTDLEQVFVDWDRSPNGEHRTLMLTPIDYGVIRRLPPEKGTE